MQTPGQNGELRKLLWLFVLVFSGYYLGAELGFALTFYPHPVSVLWPPNSILLAAMLVVPPSRWWVVLAAALPAHCLVQLESNVPTLMILCWYISNSFEALLGASILCWLHSCPLPFNRFRNFLNFVIFGALLAPFVSSFLDAGFIALNHFGVQDYWTVFRMRFFSNVLTALTFVPAIVMASQTDWKSLKNVSLQKIAEGLSLAAGLLLVSIFAFLRSGSDIGLTAIFLYAPLPFLIWAAFRFGAGGASAALLTVSITAIWGAAHGQGPFAGRQPEESAILVQFFLTSFSICLLSFGVILAEKEDGRRDLQLAEQRYREVLDTQTDLVCRFLPDTTLTFVNAACCRAFGRSAADLIGRSLLDFARPAEDGGMSKMISSLMKDHHPATLEMEAPGTTGASAWHQWTSNPVFDSKGRVSEIQAIGHDVSDRKRVEEIKQGLAHVSRLAVVGELTAMIAHEVNQPLGAILSNAEAAEMLLERDDVPLDEIRQILADIRKDDLRTNEAIQRIRALLRKRELEIKPLDLNATVTDVIQLVTGDALRRQIRICPQLHPSLPLILGDKVHLQQVLLNLVLNAMDAMDDDRNGKRWIIIRTSASDNGFVEAAVEDSGRGIAPEHLKKIFDSFFTTKREGMGLGLSIARTIIEAHKGRIWAENNKTVGCTFSISLPSTSGNPLRFPSAPP